MNVNFSFVLPIFIVVLRCTAATSAFDQDNCTVTSINPANLTLADGVLSVPYGMEEVKIQCSCLYGNDMVMDPIHWFSPDGNRVTDQINSSFVDPYSRNSDNGSIILIIPTFNDSNDGTYSCGFGKKFPPKKPNVYIDLSIEYTSEFYIAFFHGKYTQFVPSVALMTTEDQPVFYSVEAPWVGFYREGTITAGRAGIVNIPNTLTVSSFYDQSKGICIKTSSSNVTVQGNPQDGCDYYYYYCWRYYYYMRHLETFAALPLTGFCTSEYKYYAVSVNSSSSLYNSSVLVVGTEDNTMMKLIVTQSVTISMCNIVTHLIPHKEYTFMINRLQTVYIGSPNDLTGSKIVTDKEVSVFSGHQHGFILDSESSHLIKQIPPTVLWGKVYYVMPLVDVVAGYAIKIVASSYCSVEIYCDSSSSPILITYLNDQEFIVKEFSKNKFCTILSTSNILVAQFPLGVHNESGYGDLMMALIPSIEQYSHQFVFLVVNNRIDPIYVYSYVNIIVMAEYYQPGEIYLVADGNTTSLHGREWMPISNGNITEAYGTQVNVTYGVVEIFHTNKEALMTVMVYGFSSRGTYGTAVYSHANKVASISAPLIITHPTDITAAPHSNAIFKCSASACVDLSFEWKRVYSDLPKKSLLSNIGITSILTIPNITNDDVGEYYCVAWILNNMYSSQSNTARLQSSVLKPVLSLEPISQNICLSQTAIFTCFATGHEVKYQWLIESGSFPNKVSGIYSTTLVIPDVQVSDANNYTCMVSNAGGTVSSNVASLKVLSIVCVDNASRPKVMIVPSSQTVEVTQSVMLIAIASCIGRSIKYTWIRRNQIIRGETKPVLLIDNIEKKSSRFHSYRCNISDEYGNSAVSKSVALFVKRNLPVIIIQPQNVTLVLNGTILHFSLTCKANGALSYYWKKQGGNISSSSTGVTTNTLTFNNLQPTDSGNYYCIAVNGSGRKSSNLAVVTIKVMTPQQINIVPMFANVYLAQTATFSCVATGYSISYEWKVKSGYFLNKVTGINSNTLIIPNVGLSDDNAYSCVASNEGGSVSSNTARLTVIDLPVVTVTPYNQRVEVTSNVTIVAKVTGTGVKHFEYQWRHNGRIIKGKNNNTLVIYNATKSDEGDYICIISNNYVHRVSSNKVQLWVKINPPAPIISPRKAYISLTANVSLNCKADGATSYYWERKYGEIPSNAIGVYTRILTLVNLQSEDIGQYRCVATNGSGTNKSYYAKVIINKYLPNITEHPQSVSIDAYATVFLKCKSKLLGSVQVFWQKNESSRLPRTASVINKRSQDEITSILRITKAMTYYSGSYYCYVKNEIGERKSFQAQLQVKVPCPEITRLPENITVSPGHVSQFSCMAFSFGNLKYEWKRKDFADLPSKAMTSLSYLEQDLMFYSILTINMTNETAHEGWYCCVVTNECGDVEECAWLEVNSSPVIIKHPTSAVVAEYNKTLLECLADGMGPIFYQWEKYWSSNDSWIIPPNKVGTTSSKLIFDAIREEDEGVYHCIALNDDGAAISNNATVTVYSKPSITFISEDIVSCEGSKVKLLCNGSNDIDAVLPIQIKWYNASGKEVEQNERRIIYQSNNTATGQLQSVLLFDPVNFFDNGTFTCRAFNDPQYYTEESSTLNIEYIHVTPQSPHTVFVDDFVRLWCIVRGSSPPTVQWYQNNKPVNRYAVHNVQSFIVPTNSSHNTTYSCVGRYFTENMDCPDTVTANITVIVQEKCGKFIGVSCGKAICIDSDCQIVVIMCDPGCVLRGPWIVRCMGGIWPDPLPTCEKLQ